MINNENIDHGQGFDWGKASKDYAKYRDIYPEVFYEKIIGCGLCTAGQEVLDLGTGTGVLPRNLYRWGARFTGTDISGNQIAEARRLAQESGMDIEFIISSAEEIEFPAERFDTVIACQCFFYFDPDIVLPKLHRILKEDGHFCIIYMGWLAEESEILRRSEELIVKYNPNWTGGSMKRGRIDVPEPAKALFTVEHDLLYDVEVPFTRESWNGRIKACRGIGASMLTEQEIAAFEEEHLEYLASVEECFQIPHYVAMLNLRKRTAVEPI